MITEMELKVIKNLFYPKNIIICTLHIFLLCINFHNLAMKNV